MSELLAETVPLALASAISPVVVVLQVATLTGERRIARGAALAAGAAVPLVLVAAAALSLGHALSLPESPTAKGVIDVGLGAVLLALAAATLLRPPKDDEKPRGEASTGLGRSFVLGIAAMATNVTTFAFFIPAVKQIAASELDTAARAAAGGLILAIALIPAIVPLALSVAAPRAAGRMLTALGDAMHDHKRSMTVALGLGFGVWLVLKGLAEL